jgi:hypothetical protein
MSLHVFDSRLGVHGQEESAKVVVEGASQPMRCRANRLVNGGDEVLAIPKLLDDMNSDRD